MSKKVNLLSALLLFSFLILLVSRSSFEITSNQSLNSIESEYLLRVDYKENETIYYVDSLDSVIDFKIQCYEWGEGYDQTYEGLVVELRFDNNHSLMNSWLILRGDFNEHHFTSESPVSGIIQIVFYAINVMSVDFKLKMSEDFPIWAYDTYLLNEERVFFGIERSVHDYSFVNKIILLLHKSHGEAFNFSVIIQDDSGRTVENQTFPYYAYEYNGIELEIAGGLMDHEWYSISLVAQEMSNLSFIRVRYFYDHYQTPNIGRLFLNPQNQSISTIPIDTFHADPNFEWVIEDEGDIIVDPPDMTWLIILVQVVIYVVYVGLYGTTVILVIKYLVKWSRRKKELDESKPSLKYEQMSEHHVTYAPEQVYGVSFTQATADYSLESDEAMNVICSVCLQKITSHSDLIRCPSCDVAFHKNHLHQWIVNNNSCPACKASLRITK